MVSVNEMTCFYGNSANIVQNWTYISEHVCATQAPISKALNPVQILASKYDSLCKKSLILVTYFTAILWNICVSKISHLILVKIFLYK